MSFHKMYYYEPYPKQREFHHAGGTPGVAERLLVAGNQLGKTWSASMETAYHLTGIYPKWWTGARYRYPTSAWAASVTSQGTRDTVQRLLLGPPGAHGTGAIPKACIADVKKAVHGASDAVETIMVRHFALDDIKREHSDGESRLTLKSYDQGRDRWMGDTLNFIWFDEEPPEDIYTEGTTRTHATGGLSYMTFTPLLGMSKVVKRFLIERAAGTHVTTMTIDDALHYSPAERLRIIAKYPAHERDARARGIPTLGSGAIFPIDPELLKEPAISVPPHWPRICGMDFGWDHPTAAVWVAWDRDTDTVHVYDAYRRAEATPVIHAGAVRARGVWIPVAWPHDGLQHDKGSGIILADQYRAQGLNMLKNRATHAPSPGQKEGDGGNGVEAGLMDLFDRMQTGRLKVAKHLNEWFEEVRMYHREDGKVVKEADDLMDATRYAVMMLRKATVFLKPRQPIVAPWKPRDASMGMLG